MRHLTLVVGLLLTPVLLGCGTHPSTSPEPAEAPSMASAGQTNYWQCCREGSTAGVPLFYAKCNLTKVVTVAPVNMNDLPLCDL